MIAHCLFEQSGTFKNEFIKLGIKAYDYDILNSYNQTDYIVDLYNEIDKAYNDKNSIFDNIQKNDIILAFFPCTRFNATIPLGFRGELHQQSKWNDVKKLEYSMKLHNELHTNYTILSKLVIVCIKNNFKLVIENPYTSPHYLTTYWCIKPKLIDKNRKQHGDRFKKPTQYFFVGFEPKNNNIDIDYEPVEEKIVRFVKTDGERNRTEIRSEIHPQYAKWFILNHILDKQTKQVYHISYKLHKRK